MSNNHEWQLAFWIITVICGVWLLGITSAVATNDRTRATEDKELAKAITTLLQENNESHAIILSKLIRLETLISK